MWPFTPKPKPEQAQSEPEAERDPTLTELIAGYIELREEWKSFLDMQARIARREGSRQKRERVEPEPDHAAPIDKAAIRSLARQRGMIR